MKVPCYCQTERRTQDFRVDFGDCQIQDDGRVLVGMKCVGLGGHCPQKLYILFGREAWETACAQEGV